MKKNTFVPVFTIGFTALYSWYSIYSGRKETIAELNEMAIEIPKDNMLLVPSLLEHVLLIIAITIILYGLYKVVLFWITGKEIDEDVIMMAHDRKFSASTNILIWLVLLAAFGLFLTHLIPIAMSV